MTSTPSESAGPTPSPRSNGPGRLPPEKAAPRKPSALRSSAPDSTAPPARRLGPTLVVAGCLVLIFGVYWWLAAQLAAFHSVWSPDCGARLIQVQAVLQHWPHWWVSYPAQNLDPQHQNSPLYFYEFTHGGHTFVFYSFVFALISAIAFKHLGYIGLALLPMLCGLGASFAAYGIARLIRLRFPVAPLFIVALLTPLTLYSIVFWDHSVTTCVAAVALYLCLRAAATGRSYIWIAAGAVLALGLWFHEILIPFFPALAAAAFLLRRRQPFWPTLGRIALGAAPFIIGLALVNHAYYGSFMGPHLSNNRIGSASGIADFLKHADWWFPGALYTLFSWGDTNPGFTWELRSWLQQPPPHLYFELFASALMALPIIGWIWLTLNRLWRDRWLDSLILLLGIGLDGVWVYYHGDWPHSLFYACPLLVIAFAAAGRSRTPATAEASASAPASASPVPASADTSLGPEAGSANGAIRARTGLPFPVYAPAVPSELRAAMAAAVLTYTAFALINPALGGSEWGSRYLLITVPALVLFGWYVVEGLLTEAFVPDGPGSLSARVLLSAVAVLAAISALLQIHGFNTVRDMHGWNSQLADTIASAPDKVVVTTLWWPTLDASSIFNDKLQLYAGDDQHPVAPLLDRLRAADVRTFTLLGYDPHALSQFSAQGYIPLEGTQSPTTFGLWTMRYVRP